MLSSVLCIALFETVAHALAHDLPRQTSVREGNLRDSGRTPKPTAAPRIPPELRRRQDDLTTVFIGPDQTCGFISGLAGAGHDCDVSDYCVMYPATATGFGSVACCDSESNDCTVVTTCIDSSDYYSSTDLCDNGCRLDTNTLKCTESALPYCNSVRFPDAGVEDYTCDSVSISSFQLAYTTFDGENTSDDGRSWYTETYNEDGYFADASTTYSDYNDISLTGAYPSDYSSDATSSSTTSTTSKSSTSSPSSTHAPSSIVGAPASSSTSASPHLNETQKSSTPVGAIVGGTIGGIALIALIAAGAFILKRKYQKNDSDSSTSYPPLTQAHLPAGDGNGPSEMEATANNGPMQQQEFYKPQASPQAHSPATYQYQAYQPVPTSEIPIDDELNHQDETLLSTGHDLGRASSTARVSMMTDESVPTSPTPNFSQPATIFEAPGDYEYLEPPSLNTVHENAAHDSDAPHSPT